MGYKRFLVVNKVFIIVLLIDISSKNQAALIFSYKNISNNLRTPTKGLP